MCPRNFLHPNTNSSPQPWVLSLWWMQVLLLSPTQSLTSSLLIGQEENKGFALPTPLHTGCVCPARRECATGLCCSAHAFSLWEVALVLGGLVPGSLSNASPAQPPTQGAIWLIHWLSVSQQESRCLPRAGGRLAQAGARGTVNRAWLSHL